MISIREYREKAGMTQAELAVKCGVVKSTVSMWEVGARKPDIVMLKKLADIFGCSADDMLKSIDVKEGA